MAITHGTSSISTGPLGGISPPKTMSGMGDGPTHFAAPDVILTTTATRLYYIPHYVKESQTYSGIKTINAGTGDNGETYRVGIYQEASGGGPGSLVDDCGEVTLDANANTVRTLVSSFSVSPGWHYVAIHTNTAIEMQPCAGQTRIGSTGYNGQHVHGTMFPRFAPEVRRVDNPFPYVDTTYGALASTAVTPTATTNLAPTYLCYV